MESSGINIMQEELLYTSYEREETEKETKQCWMINGT